VDDANAAAFNGKWDAFQVMLDAGSPATVSFNESEVNSRLNAWNEEEDIFEEIRVCLRDGYGEATGTLDGGGVADAAFKLTGTVTLSGDHPRVNVDDIDLGKVPDIFLMPWQGEAEEPINEVLNDVDLGHTYTMTYGEGVVRIDGQP